MDYFGHVHFGANERDEQRKFLRTMNSAAIIQISEEELDRMYEDDAKSKYGNDNHFVLHGEEQRNRFRYVMDAFFPKKTYEITEEPGSKEFKAWLEKKGRTENTSYDEKGGGLE